jgi:predicted RNA-binding protein
MQALKNLEKYTKYIERHSPVTKRRGLFFFNSVDLMRPEIIRHHKRLLERYEPPKKGNLLLLLPEFSRRHTKLGRNNKKVLIWACKELKIDETHLDVCIYTPPFGIIPPELDGVYPLNQYEYAYPPDHETVEYLAKRIVEYVEVMKYLRTVIIIEPSTWQEEVADICRTIIEKKTFFKVLKLVTRYL